MKLNIKFWKKYNKFKKIFKNIDLFRSTVHLFILLMIINVAKHRVKGIYKFKEIIQYWLKNPIFYHSNIISKIFLPGNKPHKSNPEKNIKKIKVLDD